MTRKALGLAGVARRVGVAAAAVAHHAFAMFDQSKVLYMSGTVNSSSNSSTRMLGFHVAIVNDKGDTSTWSFEGGRRRNWFRSVGRRTTPWSGKTIEVGFRPMKDGSRAVSS